MRHAFAVIFCLALAACGADGEPIQPEAAVDIGITPNGVGAHATIGVSRGPLRIGGTLF